MENVVAFNNELSGLYDAKPPISKAKMASITKSAMRAIKFYKHVVQSVEKFILKCKPEYKVPGLYVIDSIVRQSRHQYGPDKDVFAPRFARNMTETFANLFRCAPEDKSRIVRVLNLWQKNNVFAPDVIQPIFDLADPSHPIYQMPPGHISMGAGPSGLSHADMSSTSNGLNSSGLDMSVMMGSSGGGIGPNDDKIGGLPDLSSSSLHEKSRSVRQLEHLQHHHHYMKRQSSGHISGCSKSRDMHSSCYDSIGGGMSSSSSTTKSHYHHHHHHHGGGDSYKYHKINTHEMDLAIRELDDDVDGVDNGDDDDDVIETAGDDNGLGDSSPPISSSLLDNNNLKQLLNDPNVLRQLQTLQNFQKFKQQEENQKHKLNELRIQEDLFEKHMQNVFKGTAGLPPGMNENSDLTKDVEFVSEQQPIEVINLDGNDSRSPSLDRDRYKRRRNTRSRSRSPRDRGGRRRGRSSRSRSRSRSQQRSSNRRRSSRERERDRLERNSNRDKERDREHERERRKKGLPDIKKEHLSVCSTTLWVGHLSKLVYQEELSDTFGEYGDIVSIDQIVPRGCAFIVMNRRQDAYKAMQALKNHKLQGRAITISWAAGKGVKSKEWKDFWDLELGVTYIPWNKLDEKTDLDTLEEGGMFDEDSMPNWMKDKLKNKDKNPSEITPAIQPAGPPSLIFGIDTTQPPPMAPQNTAAPPPPMMSMVPGQFSMAPPMSGPPQRMLGPMGPINPMTGMPIPPNLVPGLPPPHPMMMPPGMMPPGFPAGMPGPGPIGLPPGPQFPPHGGAPPNSVPPVLPPANPPANVSVSSDDQMDVEMELEDVPPPPSTAAPQHAPNFNQPPPIFAAGISAGSGAIDGVSGPPIGELFARDRQRTSGGTSRWGARTAEDENVDGGNQRWHENGAPPMGATGPGNFNARNAGGPMNMNSMDMNMPPRPDFMNDFDNRGPRGGMPGMGGGQRNGDFFQQNMNQNRFNQPTSLMQMRIPPPAAFNQRMGGPGGGNLGPMFVQRGNGGPGGPGGPNGGRQQGPGFFNPRNPFNDNLRGRGSRGPGRGGRGSGPPGVGGNWSDEDDEGNNFKRRSGPPGAGGGSRFRDRELSQERRGPPRGRSGSRNRNSERDGSVGNSRSNRRESYDDNTRNSADESNNNNNNKMSPTINKDNNSNPTLGSSKAVDTEEDWDRELQDYDSKTQRQNEKDAEATTTVANPFSNDNSNNNKENTSNDLTQFEQNVEDSATHQHQQQQPFIQPTAKDNIDVTNTAVEEMADFNTSQPQPPVPSLADESTKKQQSPACTPLYDELPPPTATLTSVPIPVTTAPAMAEPLPPPVAVVAQTSVIVEAPPRASIQKTPPTHDTSAAASLAVCEEKIDNSSAPAATIVATAEVDAADA